MTMRGYSNGYSIPPKRRPAVRLLVGCVLPLLAAPFILRLAARHSARVSVATHPAASRVSSDPADAPGGLPADVYPSRRSAVASAAGRLPAMIASLGGEPSELWLDARGCRDETVYREAVGTGLPNARCRMVEEDGEPADGAGSAVRVRVVENGEGEGPSFPIGPAAPPARRGEITLRATGPGGRTASATVRYDARPWLEDFTAFANARPGGAWLVVRSARPGASPAEARTEAEAAAADAVAGLLPGRAPGRAPVSASQSLRLAQRAVRDGGVVTDRFLQRFHRPYGDFWSEAVLLDVSPRRLSPLVAELHSAERSERAAHVGRAAAAGALLLAIAAVYALLNAVTRSYFTGRLRLGAAAAAVAVLALACVGGA